MPTKGEKNIMSLVKIENIVASTSIADTLDLTAIACGLDGAEYEPEQFPGLVYRLKNPKTALLLFTSGKVVCTGGKSITAVKTALNLTLDEIDKMGIPVNRDPEITVQNIVACADLGSEVNLNSIAITLGLDKVEYEPEQFPGLVYRLENPKIVTLIFGSGKVVFTGAKNPEDLEEAHKRLKSVLKASGLL